jgi:peroxiredoxin family protein
VDINAIDGLCVSDTKVDTHVIGGKITATAENITSLAHAMRVQILACPMFCTSG